MWGNRTSPYFFYSTLISPHLLITLLRPDDSREERRQSPEGPILTAFKLPHVNATLGPNPQCNPLPSPPNCY